MKIAMTHVDLPNESKGGVAFQVHYLANQLQKRGHQVTMFTFSPSYDDCHYQVHQYYLPPGLRQFKAFLFAKCLHQTDFSAYDIVHSHGDNYLMSGVHPQIRTYHGSAKDEARSAVRLRRRLYQSVMILLENWSTNIADINVGVSQATQHQVSRLSHIVSCGVDISHFQPGPKSEFPSILFVGTTKGRKRGDFLANLFLEQIVPSFPSVQLWTVTDQPIPGDNIINFGKVTLEHLCHLYQQAWLFCLPSTYEGFGVPYIEAMASGTSVVASPNPGACEILADGEYGVIASDANLGQQIKQLLHNHQQRQVYREKGLQRVHDFTWERVVRDYECLYAELISRYQPSLLHYV